MTDQDVIHAVSVACDIIDTISEHVKEEHPYFSWPAKATIIAAGVQAAAQHLANLEFRRIGEQVYEIDKTLDSLSSNLADLAHAASNAPREAAEEISSALDRVAESISGAAYAPDETDGHQVERGLYAIAEALKK